MPSFWSSPEGIQLYCPTTGGEALLDAHLLQEFKHVTCL